MKKNGGKKLKKQLSKNQRRRLKKRQQKKEANRSKDAETSRHEKVDPSVSTKNKVEVVYVQDTKLIDQMQHIFSKEFTANILNKFQNMEESTGDGQEKDTEAADSKEGTGAKEKEEEGNEQNEDEVSLSKRRLKQQKRMTVVQLKKLVQRPDLVEVHDANSADPLLLIRLKAYRNTVPVPRHWSRKSKYLQRKRGFEKAPFQLPAFIEATGISKMRTTMQENEEGKTLRQRARERMNAKMGKIDIDYKVLYNAFFKEQTKPQLTSHGQVYEADKEFQSKKSKVIVPGTLSSALKAALGMTQDETPPPWLINMQRYGPPPSFPSLKIPGLNAPIPPGASFGFHPGGWGRPPVDSYGVPLYGDVFSTGQQNIDEDESSQKRWGELQIIEEEDDFEDAEERMSEEEDEDVQLTEAEETAAADVNDLSKGTVDLRKGIESVSSIVDATPKQLYQVIEQKTTSVGSDAVYGSDRRYVLPTDGVGKTGKRKSRFSSGEKLPKRGRSASGDGAEEEAFKF